MKKDLITYQIEVDVRDENYNVIRDEVGGKFHSIKMEFVLDKNTEAEGGYKTQLKSKVIELGKTMKAWMPDRQITVEARLHNSISGTLMTMNSYYVNEDRYIIH